MGDVVKIKFVTPRRAVALAVLGAGLAGTTAWAGGTAMASVGSAAQARATTGVVAYHADSGSAFGEVSAQQGPACGALFCDPDGNTGGDWTWSDENDWPWSPDDDIQQGQACRALFCDPYGNMGMWQNHLVYVEPDFPEWTPPSDWQDI
jgi:hypothetical protein